MHVLEILRGLATGGRAVLTTIHQVRWAPALPAGAARCMPTGRSARLHEAACSIQQCAAHH